MLKIDFYNETDYEISSLCLSKLEYIISTSMNLDNDMEVSLALVPDEKMRELNHTYSGIDSATDVLSFPELELESDYKKNFSYENKAEFIGEIVIAVDVMCNQAKNYCVTEDREFARLCIHGFLHLIGYDHQGEDDSVIMRQKEELMISLW